MSTHTGFVGINIAHTIATSLPVVLFFLGGIEPFFSTFYSLILIVGGAISTAFFLARFVTKNGKLDQQTSSDKEIALKQASEICFSGLWFIPKKNLLKTSDSIWYLTVKQYQLSVRAAMIASDDSLSLVIGAVILVGVYMGFHAEFGLTLSRIATFSGGGLIIQIGLLVLTPWMSLIFLFNFFFRKLITKGNL